MTSVYDLIKSEVCGKDINLVRINYKGKALDPASALIRTQTGETVSAEKMTHAKFILRASTGTRKANLNLSMGYDKGSRKEDGSFDFRTLTIATMDTETGAVSFNIPSISILRNFKSKTEWEEIDLTKCDSLFPTSDQESDIEDVLTLAELRAERDHLEKGINNAKNRKANKERRETGIFQDGKRFFYVPPSNNPDPVVAFIEVSSGERIRSEKVTFPTVELTPPNGPDFEGEKVTDDKLVKSVVRLNTVRERIKALNKTARPIELGIIERKLKLGGLAADKFVWLGYGFEIKHGTDSEYMTDPKIGQRVKRGEVKIEMVPPSRVNGEWKLENHIEVPPSTNEVKSKKTTKKSKKETSKV